MVPKGTTCVVNGVEHKAYSVWEYQIIKHIFADYDLLWKYSLSLEDDVVSLKVDISTWKGKYELWKELHEEQKHTHNMLIESFRKERQLRLQSEKIDKAFKWVPWALVVAESLIVGVVGIKASSR